MIGKLVVMMVVVMMVVVAMAAARRAWRAWLTLSACCAMLAGCGGAAAPGEAGATDEQALDRQLAAVLEQQQFTGTIEQQLEQRLGRRIDPALADLGRLLFFDRVGSLHNDNACAGCHSPAHGFGDSQSIAIGIQSNLLVGPHRQGPRNQRRSPSVVNTAFYPNLMWNGRFFAPSGNPFDASLGFSFPAPEGHTRFGPNDPLVRHLLIAQAFMPPTELNEAAGFTGIRDGIDPRYFQFDDGKGERCPQRDAGGFRNEPIRERVEKRLNAAPAYITRFGAVFPAVRAGAPIDMTMFARAIAEFEFSLTSANAPIDRFARGDTAAMTAAEKRGALLFFGKANCVACHAVAGPSNQMFSDFNMHNIGVPQIAPAFGVGLGNTIFDGPAENEDYGLEQISGLAADRYRFRTSPLRNVALQPAFFHNGAFTRLDEAIGHHLDVLASLDAYDAVRAGVAADLAGRTAPVAKVKANIALLLREPVRLTAAERTDLLRFVRDSTLDERMAPRRTCGLVPAVLPSGAAPLRFEACP